MDQHRQSLPESWTWDLKSWGSKYKGSIKGPRRKSFTNYAKNVRFSEMQEFFQESCTSKAHLYAHDLA